jgi:uncharacterized protein
MADPAPVAVLAKAPIAGFAKTRLAPVLGSEGAAALQARLLDRAIATACAASVGPVTLWVTPNVEHPVVRSVCEHFGVTVALQPEGDLGVRMLTAMPARNGLIIGTDCPALTPSHLHIAANVLRDGTDVVVVPVEDGGYALIGMRVPEPALFVDMPWSTPEVMAQTRRRLRQLRLSWQEPVTLWDVDVPEDLKRLAGIGLADFLTTGIS